MKHVFLGDEKNYIRPWSCNVIGELRVKEYLLESDKTIGRAEFRCYEISRKISLLLATNDRRYDVLLGKNDGDHDFTISLPAVSRKINATQEHQVSSNL